jgi:hypothetical protein
MINENVVLISSSVFMLLVLLSDLIHESVESSMNNSCSLYAMTHEFAISSANRTLKNFGHAYAEKAFGFISNRVLSNFLSLQDPIQH